MKLIKAVISILSIIVFRSFLTQSIHGFNPIQVQLNQDMFKYEIFDVFIDGYDLIIEGYAFVIEQQHYKSNHTHTTHVEIVDSKGEKGVFQAILLPSNYTAHMQYRGTPLCSSFSLRQPNTTCHYAFENVQFRVKIPKIIFKLDETYYFNVLSHARSVNTTFKTPIQTIIKDKNVEIDGLNYVFNDQNDQASLRIVHSEVVVRNGPSIESAAIYQGSNCSTTYKNQLFYQKNSLYKDILSVVFNSSIGLTYYELSGSLSTCINSRRTIVEGANITPIYINRLMVELDESFLSLEVTKPYIQPVISKLRFFHQNFTSKEVINHQYHVLIKEK